MAEKRVREQPAKKARLGDLRPKYIKIAEDMFTEPLLCGRTTKVHMLAPETTNDAKQVSDIMSICWTLIPTLDTKLEVAALFASAIGAFAPTLLESILLPLRESGAAITELTYPSMANDQGYILEQGGEYEYHQHVIFIGICLILPFKRIEDLNYKNYINACVEGLGGVLGLSVESINAVKFPLDMRRAKMVQQVFSCSDEFKIEIINYILRRASDRSGDLMHMARYVCEVTAWSEMSLIVTINNEFVSTNSPVLKHPLVLHEVERYISVLARICRSDRPQYFRYFCTWAEEEMMKRRNFPILGAAALEVTKRKSKSISNANFAGTTKPKDRMVERLVKVHLDYIAKEDEKITLISDE